MSAGENGTGGQPREPSESDGSRRVFVSVVTPAFNEAENLPELHRRLQSALDPMDIEWEWIVIDDHSTDGTFEVLTELANKSPRLLAVRFSRNFGSHTAIACGLSRSRGNCAVVMSGDLQDPPEEIPRLLDEWRNKNDVVWAVRKSREGEGAFKLGFSRLYYALMKKTEALKNLPSTGADFFLLDRRVIDALNSFQEGNVSILALITWMGFRQASVYYEKKARLHGQSGWSLAKKLKLVADSITSFTYFPVRMMSYLGCATALLGFVYAAVITIRALEGAPVQGWSSLMAVVLVLGGVQMIMMGVLGEYLWRTLYEARRRPRYVIEAVAGQTSGGHGERG